MNKSEERREIAPLLQQILLTLFTHAALSKPVGISSPLGPIEPVFTRLDPLPQTPIRLSDNEFADLVDFMCHGLLDPRILPERLKTLVPKGGPSGRQTLKYEFP